MWISKSITEKEWKLISESISEQLKVGQIQQQHHPEKQRKCSSYLGLPEKGDLANEHSKVRANELETNI
jgi:hypothetical protein